MRTRKSMLRARPWALTGVPAALLASLLLAACGGGGGTSEPVADTTPVAGSVFAGPVAGASVVVRDAAGTTLGGPVTTAADGTYTVAVPTSVLSGDLLVEATGGTFTDEATGTAAQAVRLRALRPSTLGTGSAVHLTPASTVLADLVAAHGRTLTQARNAVGNAFGFIPDVAVRPANAPAAQANQDARLAGLRAAAFSQLTRDLGLPPDEQFDLLAALAEDLADGSLDGAKAGASVTPDLPEDVQNRFALALTGFLGSARDLTGLDAGQMGFLPFGTVALTATRRVEYVPVDPGAALGETPFRLRITRRDGGQAEAGLALTLAPTMHMAAHEHGTPVGAVADNGDGSYDGAVYYTMPGGNPFGYWTLGVSLGGGEAVRFHPAVGSPSSATLRGQSDLVWDDALDAESRRAYLLFDSGLVEENAVLGTYGFSLFVAAREDAWVYPPLSEGVVLRDESGTPWTASVVTVEVSRDGAAWTAAAPAGPGRWSVSGLTGIDPNSEQLTFFVRLTVNGEVKTTDGLPVAADGSNGYAKLTSGGASCCN